MLLVEPRVDATKLHELLAEEHESDCLEYVAQCDLAERRDIVELATEVGALAARGGYLVIGADDHGRPMSALDARMAQLFDDATVRDKLARYLPDVELHVGRHQRPEGLIVVIAVMPHPDGAVVFAADGAFDRDGKQTLAFRKGEMFVRHGSKSERPSQRDIARLRKDAVEQARLWVERLDKVADLVVEIGHTIDRERPTHPDGRLFRLHEPTQIPIARERLKTALGLLEQVGGPELPAAWRLADGAHYVFANPMMGDVQAAAAEIAFAVRAR